MEPQAFDRETKLTIMVDASYNHARGIVGIGLVLHEADRPGRNGPVVARLSEAYDDVPIGQMEEFAVFRALEIAHARGVRYVKVRSDYNQMRRRLKIDHHAGHTGAGLHGRVLLLARLFDDAKFAYQPRRKNQAAHTLARAAAANLPPEHRPDLFSAADISDPSDASADGDVR